VTNGIGSAASQPVNPPASGGPQLSQQNLNQIVIDYLAKKGYHRTEAVLRAESANQEIPKMEESRPNPNAVQHLAQKYLDVYIKLQAWTDDALDMYKPEVERLSWPFFVYMYLGLVEQTNAVIAENFWKKFVEPFRTQHEHDIQLLKSATLPEHLKADGEAKRYLSNKYRVNLSSPAQMYILTFLESLSREHYALLIKILETNIDLRVSDRATDDRYSFASVILRAQDDSNLPPDDEGIPGHKSGNAIITDQANVGNTLATLKLGKLQMDKDTEEDVRADLEEIDSKMPPAPGQSTLVETHEKINIKQEEDEDGPTRTEIPFPVSTSRDVHMEVTKIRESRDRLKVEGRTGGIGPGVSVCMYTFHNSADSINCMDFSSDLKLAATGMAESYIRVWTLDGSPLGPQSNGQAQASQRLIGHGAPVYAVRFAPAVGPYDESSTGTGVKWLLSGGGDGNILLWSLDTFQPVVKYQGHTGPVWSLDWSPQSHYFVSGGLDKLGRIWTTDKVHPVRILAGHDKDVEVVAYHPNSAYVFTASTDRTIRMWAVTTGNAVRMFTSHTTPITAVACSPDGKLLASADDNGSIILWDLATGKRMKQMRGHGKGGIWSLSWNNESTILLSGGADNTVRVWDVHGPPKEPAAAKPGEAGKAGDGSGPTMLQSAGAKKGRKEAVVTADQISAFPTKSSPVYHVQMTSMNLALAGSAYLPELQARPSQGS
jgi:transcription initiation factor TFIID subunit 5